MTDLVERSFAGTSTTNTTIALPGDGNLSTYNSARGICSLVTAAGKEFRFRTNPNSITWKYVLNTNIEDTYGGRVIQILSARITSLNIEVEAGWGGWPYVVKLAYFLRDMMNDQRNGQAATFKYTTRNWKLKVFASSIPFTDTVGRPNTKIPMVFNVVEDSTKALQSQTLGAELKRLKDGIGYTRNAYNSQLPNSVDADQNGGLVTQVTGALSGITTALGSGNPLKTLFGGAAGPTSAAGGSLSSIFGGF